MEHFINYPDLFINAFHHSFLFLSNPRIACLCAPTLYKKLLEIKPAGCEAKVFEFDRRFAVFGEDFIFYDYKKPLDLPDSVTEHSFDLVFVDPPFLAEECLTKTAQTVKYLAKEKIILCTGKFKIYTGTFNLVSTFFLL